MKVTILYSDFIEGIITVNSNGVLTVGNNIKKDVDFNLLLTIARDINILFQRTNINQIKVEKIEE